MDKRKTFLDWEICGKCSFPIFNIRTACSLLENTANTQVVLTCFCLKNIPNHLQTTQRGYIHFDNVCVNLVGRWMDEVGADRQVAKTKFYECGEKNVKLAGVEVDCASDRVTQRHMIGCCHPWREKQKKNKQENWFLRVNITDHPLCKKIMWKKLESPYIYIYIYACLQ